MKKLSPCLLGLSLAAACSLAAVAQESSPAAPPKILQITREFSKPYKNGAAHDKTESVFAQAMSKAKWPTHYVGMTSLSGRQRALYLTSYDSLEAWEKDNAAMAKNSVLAAELERASIADGELLQEVDQGVFRRNEEMSSHAMGDLSHQRFMEVSVYEVRPGRGHEWEEAVKLVKEGYEKAATGAHWAMFSQIYGGQGARYLVLISHHSLAEVDKGFLDDRKFGEALGEDGLKKLDRLVAESVESSQHELFQIDPHMSYVPEEWIKADPEFWKPKAPAMAKPAMDDKKGKP
jgi:hypothetical protein